MVSTHELHKYNYIGRLSDWFGNVMEDLSDDKVGNA